MKLTGLKILVVDDDEFFREVLKKCIEDEGGKALSVESVAYAKRGVPFFEPDFILSDVQMPGETGIEFLAWAKKEGIQIPIIIMTGFSELADASSAASAGAAGFLAKPFKQADLLKVIEDVHKCKEMGSSAGNGQGGAVSSSVDRELDYMKVSVEDFLVGSQIQVPIYLRLPTGSGYRFVKVAHHGEDLSLERVRSYREKGVHHLYLTREDYLNYVGLTVRVTKAAAQSSAISDEKRARLIRNTMEVVEQQMFCGEISEELFDNAKTLVEVSVSVMADIDPGYFVLESIKSISDELYAHAAGVSMVACMIGKSIGWTSPKTLSKVALAGLLHDIGKRQLPRELAIKPKSQMSADEIVLYETHPAKGVAILAEMDFIPSDVVQAVGHHHERGNGRGFPSHLIEPKIFPLAKVIAVADEFCTIYMKNLEAREKMDPKQSLHKLVEFHSDGLSPEPLIALHRAFGVSPPEHLLKKVKKEVPHGA